MTGTGRTDVVIGAGSGMGAAVARALHGRGNRLLLADRDDAAAGAVAAGLDGAEAFACDITDPAAVAALVDRVGTLGAFVLTAGLSPNMADGRRIYTVNLVATDAVVAAFEPTLAEGSAGVVFASSAGHLIPQDDGIDAILDAPQAPDFFDRLAAVGLADDPAIGYAISKRGVHRLVQRRARDWGAAGARLVSLSPGIIDTPMGRLEYDNQPVMADMVASSYLAREGDPAEIAAAVAFLVSDAASFITGTDLLVDGGSVASGRSFAS